ncbi:hypothetical protein AGOR_G00098050 [Albula goreensis]|uniref:Beta-2-glycoprotein 1 n=1 Tax=Albula goreensis TaxID=1534307 RepID=A0A8T3DJV1_9TELE|nr:hypothetical protein AGOR_G00098050 [Albula goreensis]
MSECLLLLLLCQLSLYSLVTPVKVCGRPPVGPHVDDGDFQRVYEVGHEVFLSCKPGYSQTKGTRKITCGVSGTWSHSTFSCEPKRCSIPGPLLHGAIQAADNVYRSTINYTCNEGYILRGSSFSHCLSDGTWSHSLPSCDPVICSLPEIPKYGKFIASRKFKDNTTFFGDSVEYVCPPPLALFGDERGFCTSNGNWTRTPECRLVTCPPPTGIPNGFMSFAVKRDHGYKERVRYGCNANYVLDGPMEAECEKTGNWSTKPVCRAPCTVGIERGRIFYNGKKMWIKELKPKRILHADLLAVYCKNEEKNCGYPVATQCIDGKLQIPACFKEPGRLEYNLNPSSLPSEIEMCKSN